MQLSLLDNSINQPDGKNQAAAAWIEETVIPAFEAAMAEAGTPVEVSFEGRGVDDEDYKAQLALDLGAGEGPDVFSIDGIWVGEFATAEYIAPLAEVVGPSADEWEGWSQINEAVQANGSFDGELGWITITVLRLPDGSSYRWFPRSPDGHARLRAWRAEDGR